MSRLHLLPTPKSVTGADADGNYAQRSFEPLLYTAKPEWNKLVHAFAAYAARVHGVLFADGSGGIELCFDVSLPRGHYRLDTTGEVIRISAVDNAGIGYGLATLLQLMRADTVPVLVIEDHPDCDYRALMVDVARQWHPFFSLLNYVDLCFFLKIRYLHIHFIDDQRYTLPSDHFPMLPTKGEHYSKLGIAQLVEYAHARGIVLIPEFEAPGHARAMVSACSKLFACTGSEEGTNVICVGKPGIYETLDCMIGEICELFPHSPYIHIGGDEAQIQKWNDCPDCRAYMEAHGIPDVHALYTHFVVNMTNIVLAHDRTPIVWEGFPREGTDQISRDVIVVSWENYYHYTHELLDEGFRIINASWQPMYITPNLRWTSHDILSWNVYNWQHWWPKSPAHLNPIHVQPTRQVWGAQLCAWEWNYSGEIEYVKENLAALSERTWSVPRLLENEEFDAALASLRLLMGALLRPIDS